eukprot:5499-Heterococcus_DN1.PRE.3
MSAAAWKWGQIRLTRTELVHFDCSYKLRSMQGGEKGRSGDATSLNDTASYALDAFLCVFKCIQVFRGHCSHCLCASVVLFACCCALVDTTCDTTICVAKCMQ